MNQETLNRRDFGRLALAATFLFLTGQLGCSPEPTSVSKEGDSKALLKAHELGRTAREATLSERLTIYKELGVLTLQATSISDRRSLLSAFNRSKYNLRPESQTIVATRQFCDLSPVLTMTARESVVVRNVAEIDLSEMYLPLKLLRLLPPTIVFVENYSMAVKAIRGFGISPGKHLLIEFPKRSLDGASYMEDAISECTFINNRGQFILTTTDYGNERGFGEFLSIFSSFFNGMFEVKPLGIKDFEGGNLEVLYTKKGSRLVQRCFITRGNRPREFIYQVRDTYAPQLLTVLLPFGPNAHTDEMVTFHRDLNGNLVVLLAGQHSERSVYDDNYDPNARAINSALSSTDHDMYTLPTGSLTTVNVAHFHDHVIFPAYKDLSSEQIAEARTTLKRAFPSEHVRSIEVDPTGKGGANCLTGGIPTELFYLLKALLESEGKTHLRWPR